MRPWMIAAMMAAGASTGSFGQLGVTSLVQMELRLMPQIGVPRDPGGVIDAPGGAHHPVTGAGQVRRFELQYRLRDADERDDIVPDGLAFARLNIVMDGGGNGRLEHAVLSNREQISAGWGPASSPDLSGPVGPTSLPRLHTPFVGNPPFVIASDGTLLPGPGGPAQVFSGINPWSFVQPGQGDDRFWYGLFSFNFVSGDVLAPVTLRTEILPLEGGQGTRFAFHQTGASDLLESAVVTNAAAGVPIPAGGTGSALLMAYVAAARCRQRLRRTAGR